jgi:hypothetical protein
MPRLWHPIPGCFPESRLSGGIASPPEADGLDPRLPLLEPSGFQQSASPGYRSASPRLPLFESLGFENPPVLSESISSAFPPSPVAGLFPLLICPKGLANSPLLALWNGAQFLPDIY